MIRGRPRRRDADASRTLDLCGLLLEYPHERTHAGAGELRDAADGLPDGPTRDALRRFLAWWTAVPLDAIRRHYVETFDLKRRCGLYLTYYEEGDKRGRGMALLRLRKLYRAAGLPMADDELPDFLPVMLEFAASAPEGRGLTVLGQYRAEIELVRLALVDEGSPYAALLDAVTLVLGEPSAVDRARAATVAAQGPPQELVGLEPFGMPDVHGGAEARR
ncbi:MAG: nitrate reductase molybdenum cofactor assembly chaperone [Solirubrobacteraceae bacterium]|nr:nitrate reductase molybdenum cofactor assembly chaperone [Solirubrobacteraceae bacterium]